MTDEDFTDFSKAMVHRSLFANGFFSAIRNPGMLGDYLICLMAIRYGW